MGMTRKERLLATLQGQPVDRPAVCLYELNGLDQNPDDPDAYHIYSHPSWRPLLDLARDRSDRIVLRPMRFENPFPTFRDRAALTQHTEADGKRYFDYQLTLGGQTFSFRDMRERDVDTLWNLTCPFKEPEDLECWLDTPPPDPGEPEPNIQDILAADEAVGEGGITAVDIASPLCEVSQFFDMADFLVVAMTEPELFHRALDRVARQRLREVEAFSQAAPGRLWRIYGPEYACPPFLPPSLFREYVVRYDQPLVHAIQRHGGFARIHAHGNVRAVLPDIAAMGYDGIDPLEPPPHGDIPLSEVRRQVGGQMVLFGNIELTDIENQSEAEFRQTVQTALAEGCGPDARGFVLMHTACPIGRVLSEKTLRNYEVMVEMCETYRKDG